MGLYTSGVIVSCGGQCRYRRFGLDAIGTGEARQSCAIVSSNSATTVELGMNHQPLLIY